MDVSRHRFQACLPFILEDIANAHFVSIDLELSGIPGPLTKRSKTDGVSSSGKPTLQERYTDIKQAVERYQVLQLGLTCVIEDRDCGHYTLKPYNFFLDPVPNEKLHVERIFAYQSGAVGFLLDHKFRMEAPFLEGVAYFSREEEAFSRQRREEKSVYTDIDIDPDDLESIRFAKAVTEEIENWKARRGPKDTFLNITTPESHESQTSDHGLNKYQKALVHQIVRKHPELVAVGRQSFIQIIDHDEERERNLQSRRKMYFERDLGRQIGLRWPIEAMVGGDLSGLDPKEFLVYVDGRQEVVTQQVMNLKARLNGKRTVLVGHNVLLDLMYFYKCFFGTLPDHVEDFQRVIHELFPIVIDTKYLATHNHDNPAMANSSLEQLDVELAKLPYDKVPLIILHENHGNYFSNTAAHEAGYDSFQTAKVLIRLSTKLERAGTYVDAPIDQPPSVHALAPASNSIRGSSAIISSDEDYFTPEEEGVPVPNNYQPAQARSSDSSDGGVSLLLDPLTLQENLSPDMTTFARGNTARTPKSGTATNKFAHKGMFDSLLDLPVDMDGASESIAAQDHEPQYVMMPPFDSHFWEVYGNKLRVNGTVEGVCNLLGE
ncbi:MAG: hypothetical protein Q9195_007042 [Heterodermia aff. obscurata]